MSSLLRMVVCLSGVVLILTVIRNLVQKKLKEIQSLFWLATAAVLILLGLFPGVTGWFAGLFGVEYAPSIVFFATSVMSIYGIYRCYRANAELEQRVSELATQVSMLNYENIRLRSEGRQ